MRGPTLYLAASVLVAMHASPTAAERRRFGPIAPVAAGSPHPYPAGTAEGAVVWSHTFERPEARALMVHFARLTLGPGDRLEVVDGSGATVFRYEGDHGARWSIVVPGAILGLRLVADASGVDFGVEVDRLAFSSEAPRDGQAPPNFVLPGEQPHVIIPPDRLDDIHCLGDGVAGACPDDANKFTAGTAVARLYVTFVDKKTREEDMSFCTGFLIAYANRQDLIMTAAHCLEDDEAVTTAIDAEFDALYPLIGGTCNCHSANPSVPPCDIAANPCDSPDSSGPGGAMTPATCGDGAIDPGEACDPDAVPTGCPPGAMCRSNCICEVPCSGPVCHAVNWQIDPNMDCDWGLIKCDAVPNAGNRHRLPLAAFDPGSDSIYIPQHPDGRCKEIEINVADDRVAGCSFSHLVDTQGGSSGAPVIRTSNDAVIGVHVAGTGNVRNFATRMSHILGTPVPAAPPAPNDGVEGVSSFLGYKIACSGPLPPAVEVEDQFQRRTIEFKRPALLLAPAKPAVDCAGLAELDCAVRLVDQPPPPAVGLLHQRCYGVNDPQARPGATVDLVNQFGSESCRITGRATVLCTRTAKEEQP
jgi:hypothetical protein